MRIGLTEDLTDMNVWSWGTTVGGKQRTCGLRTMGVIALFGFIGGNVFLCWGCDGSFWVDINTCYSHRMINSTTVEAGYNGGGNAVESFC